MPKFVVSEDKIRLLFKSGMPVRYIGPGPNPYLDNKDDGGVDAKAGGAKAGAKAAAAVASMSNSGAGGDSSKAKATGRSKGSPALLVCFSFSSLPLSLPRLFVSVLTNAVLQVDEASITLSSGYTTTESKADDPNDGTYGAASRKLSAGAGAAAAPPKRVSPRKSSSTLGKRARGGEDE